MKEETEFIEGDKLLKRLDKFILLHVGQTVVLDIREKEGMRTTPKTFMILRMKVAFRSENKASSDSKDVNYMVWYECVEVKD